MRYLVTGGAGFIGSHLVDHLVERGEEVVVLDDLSTGRLANLEPALATGQVEFVKGSTDDAAAVDALAEGSDRIFHLASAVGVRLIVDNAYEALIANVRGSDVVLHAAAAHRARLLYASTSEIYGKNSLGALHESSDRQLGAPQRARWTYATAKVFGEQLALGLAKEKSAEMIVARLFNTTGPRQSGAYGMVLPAFVDQALRNEDLTVHGDGSQSRCFAHVDDTVRALVGLMDSEVAVGGVFNVGSERETSVLDLANLVIARTGSTAGIRFVPFDDAYGEGFEELGRRQPDTTALRGLTGWTSKLSLEDAIDDLIASRKRDATLA